ncbi:MAG TPA: hypothetical protein VEY10_00030 [Flavisolibacter sp.]|jgi:hypothetical protein|nr:hypothetical protein [Flavisolibacter sp.]
MVITDKFVYIHKPKTGGTFVTDALLKLYDGKWNLFLHAKLALLKVIHYKNDFGTLSLTANKHGGCNDIPVGHQQKTIVSTIRNPFDYYVSQYEFGWWKRKSWHDYYKKIDGFEKYSASFPNLSFQQFMELMALAFNASPHQDFNNPNALGRNTIEFINDCFYEPEQVIKKIDEKYISSGAYKKDMFPVEFIFTHRLNQQLYDFLLAHGYPSERIAFIITKQKVLPQGKGRTKEQKWEKYYTPELKELVRKKDWFLFEVFPEFEEAHTLFPV